MAVVCSPSWKGTSNNNKWDNHESSLSEAEMIALAETIINLGEMNALPAGVRQEFKDLAAGLKNGTVTITKGIHERDSKVHFDVKSSVGALPRPTFHVFVKAGDDVVVTSAPGGGWGPTKGKTIDRTLFKFVVSGLSFKIGNAFHLYPAIYATIADVEKPLGRPRSKSLSIGNSSAPYSASENFQGL